jgi:hypothetical protein
MTHGARRLAPRALLAASALLVLAAASPGEPPADGPAGYTLTRTGERHDFDYFVGAWSTQQHRLKARGVGSKDWEDFPATLCMRPYLGGLVTVDELYMPTRRSAGFTLRTFDIARRQWLIYWVSSERGKLEEPPMRGGFDGNRGEFYAADEDQQRPIKVRFLWTKIDHDHARWEQAFSYDERTWETNWTADFTRADASQLCENGRPKGETQ